ncbi:MAG: DUF6635 family protein [Thiobacillus sp.]
MGLLLIPLGLGALVYFLLWYWTRPTQRQAAHVSFDENSAVKQDAPREEVRRAAIESAITSGTTRYILGRDKKIDEFVKRHYSFRGALKIHSHAVGLDIIRVPVNIVWSLVNIFLALVGLIAKVIRLHRIQDFVKRIPPGLETDMDKQISWLIVTELLELPHRAGSRISTNDALMAEIMKDPGLRSLIEEELESLDQLKANPKFKEELNRKLAEYGATRTGAADLASNVVLLVTSQFAIGQASFGALSAGSAVSASVAQSIAVSNFWLGTTAGSYYYAVVPVAVSMRLLVAMTALIAVVLALVSTFIGIFTDPIQAKLGLHHRRLRKLVKAVEKDLLGKSDGEFQLREKYIGRVFDIVDFLALLGRAT